MDELGFGSNLIIIIIIIIIKWLCSKAHTWWHPIRKSHGWVRNTIFLKKIKENKIMFWSSNMLTPLQLITWMRWNFESKCLLRVHIQRIDTYFLITKIKVRNTNWLILPYAQQIWDVFNWLKDFSYIIFINSRKKLKVLMAKRIGF